MMKSKVSQLKFDVSTAFRNLLAVEANLESALETTGSSAENSTSEEFLHHCTSLDKLECDVEDLTSHAAVEDAMRSLRRARSRRRRLVRQRTQIFQHRLPIQPYGPLHEMIDLKQPCKIYRAHVMPARKGPLLSSNARKAARAEKRLLKEVAETYETMKTFRSLHNFFAPKSTDNSSPWTANLDRLEARLKCLRRTIFRSDILEEGMKEKSCASIPVLQTMTNERDQAVWSDTSASTGRNRAADLTSLTKLFHLRAQWDQYLADPTDPDASSHPVTFPQPPEHPSAKWADCISQCE